MLRLNAILGQATDPEFFDELHHLQHNGRVERIVLGAEDAARHRLRVQTDAGTECAISLPRDQRLNNGSILLFEQDRAIVVMMREEEVLKLAPADAAAALELGYFAGNMHWPVRFHAHQLPHRRRRGRDCRTSLARGAACRIAARRRPNFK